MVRPSIELRYRVVDVFSDRPLAGNALCVVLDPCPEPVMAAIAREVNLSETTFPVVTGPGAYEVRILTPASELPFAGHPTLGTAWVLGPGEWAQTSPGGTVRVEAGTDGAVMSTPDPTIEPAPAEQAGAAAAALGLRADEAWLMEASGTRHLLVPTGSPLERIEPDLRRVLEVSLAVRCAGVAAMSPLDAANVHARVFLPAIGTPEDPGTGSAAGAIGLLARRLWDADADITIHQGAEIGRPSRIEVHAEAGAVRVGGRVAPCAEGVFTL